MPYKNSEDKLEWQRRWRKNNPDKAREKRRESNLKNRWYKRADTATRKWGEKVHWSIFKRIGENHCVSCGTPADGVDHIICKKHGGRNVEDNLQPMCLTCNQKKQATCKGD